MRPARCATGVGVGARDRAAPGDRVAPGNDESSGEAERAASTSLPSHSATLDQLPAAERVAPTRLRIDAAGIGAPVVPVAADADSGELAVPPTPDTIAWYEHGPTAGEPGSAVLAAHVDWQGERGAFFHLGSVPVGALAVVTLADGTDVTFRVVGREQVSKDELPVERIFDRQGPSRLTLVTCGGEFDRDTRTYEDNIVLTAERVDR